MKYPLTEMPERILVVGSSGTIGRHLIRALCGEVEDASDRVSLLSRSAQDFRVTESQHVDLCIHQALCPWLERKPDAIVYLAGIPAMLTEHEPALGQRIHTDTVAEAIDAINSTNRRIPLIIASSSAIHSSVDSAYALQKRQSEALLLASGLPGFALRFPTILPRREVKARTSALNLPLLNALSRRPSVWPIRADRRLRVMSLMSAVGNLLSALHGLGGDPAVAIDLPAAVVTPRSLCAAAGAPDPQVEIDRYLDDLMAQRAVELETTRASELGFPDAESIGDLVVSLKALQS